MVDGETGGTASWADNRLLALLSPRAASEMRKRATPFELRFEDVLHHAGVQQRYVYFPTSGIVSTLYLMDSGSSAEIGIIGRDGIVGLAAILGGGSATTRSMVQVPGHALRMSATDLVKIAASDTTFSGMLMRYTQVMLTHATQTAICNRYHTTLQQLCRWILHSIDLNDSQEITMTQQLMAEMLGVRREAVSGVASQLRTSGTIDYARGRLRVLNRAGLEKRVCECYWVVTRETDRLLGKRQRRKLPAERAHRSGIVDA